MKFALPRGKQWLTVIIIAIFVLYLGNRLWAHRDITLNWKEEVQLVDGSRVWIKRAKITEIKSGVEPFTNPRGVRAEQIIIPGEKDDVVWEFPLSPMILERGETADRWVMIAMARNCEDITRYGSTGLPYIQFDYLRGQWIYKQADPKWYGKRANLSGVYENTYEQLAKRVGKSFTAEQIRQFNYRIYAGGKALMVVDANYKTYCH